MDQAQRNPAEIAAENYEKNVVTYTTGPFAAILIEHARPQPGETVLDIACGTGIVARLAAPLVGNSGAVVAVDINPAMLAVAGALPSPHGAVIEWREGSALELPCPEDYFDLALCQAGLQFFPDRSAALKEMHRVIKRGGRVAISVWRSIEHNPAAQIIWGAIARQTGEPLEQIAPAFSLGSEAELRTLVEAAGFTDITISVRDHTVREPRSEQLIVRILTSVAGVAPAYAAMTEAERARVADAVEYEIRPALTRFIDGDEQLYPMSAHIVVAKKPLRKKDD